MLAGRSYHVLSSGRLRRRRRRVGLRIPRLAPRRLRLRAQRRHGFRLGAHVALRVGGELPLSGLRGAPFGGERGGGVHAGGGGGGAGAPLAAGPPSY